GRLRDRRVAEQRLLDLARVDVLPTPDDEVIRPPCNVDEAVVVEPAEIPRAEPAAAQCLRGRLRCMEVPLHDVRPLDDDLPYRAGGHVASVRIDDAQRGER